MIPKSGRRLSGKIMLERQARLTRRAAVRASFSIFAPDLNFTPEMAVWLTVK
jgi:hypothetical protein